MKGVILAGGHGTRLYPLTKATNKHLLPVGREPMLYHPIRQMVGAGITEILVVTSTDHMGDVVRCLGSGVEFGCRLSYRVQETAGAPARSGAAALDEHQVIEIEEKPKNPKSHFAVVGLYFYDGRVFDIIRGVEPSARGEYEITSVNNAYIAAGQLRYDVCRGRWTDAGTFDSLREANTILGGNENRILSHDE